MSEIEFIDLVTPTGSVVKAIFVKLKPEQDMHDIEPIAKSIARSKLGMGSVDVLDYVWSERAMGWAVLIQKKPCLHRSKVEMAKVAVPAASVVVKNSLLRLVEVWSADAGGWCVVVQST